MRLDEVVHKYKLNVTKVGNKTLYEVPGTPFAVTAEEGESGVVRIRIDVDRDKLEELVEEMVEEGESADSISDALDEMVDDVIRIAYAIIDSLKSEGKEVKSELLGSVMDVKDILSEVVEYVEENA